MVHLRAFLTPRRLRYPCVLGAVLWFAWCLSLTLGTGKLDLAGQPVGTDYLQFYAAGMTLLKGDGANLYDIAYQSRLQQQIIGPGLKSYYGFITPPFLAWLFVPFSLLPYTLSFAVWSSIGLACLWFALRAIGVGLPLRGFLWSLTWFPVFASVSFGQNALLTLLVFATVYRMWSSSRPFVAGLLLSLTMYKPQLALGIVLLWLLDARRSWPALSGFALGSGGLALLSFGLLPDASAAYVAFARDVLPDLPTWQSFPIWHLHTVRGFWRLLLPWWPWLGDAVTVILGGGGIWSFARFWHQVEHRYDLGFAGAIALSLWLTPHAMIYDWSILLISAFLAWRAFPLLRERFRPYFAVLWVAALLSSILTNLQLKLLPVAIQLSLPALMLVYCKVHRLVRNEMMRADR